MSSSVVKFVMYVGMRTHMHELCCTPGLWRVWRAFTPAAPLLKVYMHLYRYIRVNWIPET